MLKIIKIYIIKDIIQLVWIMWSLITTSTPLRGKLFSFKLKLVLRQCFLYHFSSGLRLKSLEKSFSVRNTVSGWFHHHFFSHNYKLFSYVLFFIRLKEEKTVVKAVKFVHANDFCKFFLIKQLSRNQRMIFQIKQDFIECSQCF